MNGITPKRVELQRYSDSTTPVADTLLRPTDAAASSACACLNSQSFLVQLGCNWLPHSHMDRIQLIRSPRQLSNDDLFQDRLGGPCRPCRKHRSPYQGCWGK